MNDQFHAARQAAALSRKQLAEQVHAWILTNHERDRPIDEHHVGKIERGEIRWPNTDYRAAFHSVLGVDSDIALGFKCSGRTSAGDRSRTSPTESIAGDGGNLGGPRPASPPSPVAAQPPVEPSRANGIEAIELIRRAEASDVGSGTLAAISDTVDQLALRYTHVAPSESLATLLAYQRYLAGLLAGRLTLVQRKELMATAGWLSLLAATAHMDLGQDLAAAANLRVVRGLAAEVGDATLDAWAMETEAWHALSLGRLDHAAALCGAGLSTAAPRTAAYVQLCTQAARVSARLGQVEATHRHIDGAVTAVAELPPGRTGHHFEVDERRTVAHCAAALVWLDEPDRSSVEWANRAVGQFGPGDVHHLATARMNLALALARSDEPHEAVRLGHLALDSSWRLCRTDRFLADDLNRTLLAQHPASREVHSFHDRFIEADCFDEREAIEPPDLPQLEAGRD